MSSVSEDLAMVIETAYAGIAQMPRQQESEAERAVCSIARLVKDGWELQPRLTGIEMGMLAAFRREQRAGT